MAVNKPIILHFLHTSYNYDLLNYNIVGKTKRLLMHANLCSFK